MSKIQTNCSDFQTHYVSEKWTQKSGNFIQVRISDIYILKIGSDKFCYIIEALFNYFLPASPSARVSSSRDEEAISTRMSPPNLTKKANPDEISASPKSSCEGVSANSCQETNPKSNAMDLFASFSSSDTKSIQQSNPTSKSVDLIVPKLLGMQSRQKANSKSFPSDESSRESKPKSVQEFSSEDSDSDSIISASSSLSIVDQVKKALSSLQQVNTFKLRRIMLFTIWFDYEWQF